MSVNGMNPSRQHSAESKDSHENHRLNTMIHVERQHGAFMNHAALYPILSGGSKIQVSKHWHVRVQAAADGHMSYMINNQPTSQGVSKVGEMCRPMSEVASAAGPSRMRPRKEYSPNAGWRYRS